MHTSKHSCRALSLACVSHIAGENMHEHDLHTCNAQAYKLSLTQQALQTVKGLRSLQLRGPLAQVHMRSLAGEGHIPYKQNRRSTSTVLWN
jgi:hypothetical protein